MAGHDLNAARLAILRPWRYDDLPPGNDWESNEAIASYATLALKRKTSEEIAHWPWQLREKDVNCRMSSGFMAANRRLLRQSAIGGRTEEGSQVAADAGTG
jgi:hypothetical protein